jgi:predicted MFS family arabinose efflux permease
MPPALSLRIILTALLPFALGYLLSYLLRAVNAVVAPDLVADIGLSAGELGLLTAAYLGAFALFQLPLGVLLDRYGPRRVQAGLLGVACLGCLAFAAAPGFLSLFAARAVIGLGFSAGLMAGYKASSMWVPAERRSLVNAAIMATGAFGIVFATEPTEYLVSLIGWRSAFMVFAALTLAVAILIFLAVPKREDESAPAPVSLSVQFGQLLRILRLALFWRIVPLLALTAGVQIALHSLWAGPWFRDVMGLSRPEVARHLLWMAFAFMIGILSAGIIADRLGRRGVSPITVMLGCHAVYFIAQAIIVFEYMPLAVPAWLATAATGQVAILAYPWLAQHVGNELAGRSNAAINFSVFLVAFATQFGVGLIIGLFPATQAGYEPSAYRWAFGFFLILQLAALAWYGISRRKEHA